MDTGKKGKGSQDARGGDKIAARSLPFGAGVTTDQNEYRDR